MRIRSKALCALVALTVIFSATYPVEIDAAADDYEIQRFSCSNPLETSISICREQWFERRTDYVIIVNEEALFDATAAIPLSAMLDAPILLSGGELPEDELISQLDALSCRKIFIIGGAACVCDSFAAELAEKGYLLERICGYDRFETSAAIAEKMLSLGANFDSVFIAAESSSFAAFCAAPAAALLNRPILFFDGSGQIPDSVLRVIGNSPVAHTIVLGEALPDSVEASLRRAGIAEIGCISGSDQYRLSLAVDNYFSSVLSSSEIVFTSGSSCSGTLLGSILAAKRACPIALIDKAQSFPELNEHIARHRYDTVYAFGSENDLPSNAVDEVLTSGVQTSQSSSEKKAYITFDDGPSQNTLDILDILDEYSVKATFFVIHSDGYEDCYREIVKRGHTIALHSYTHDYSVIYSSPAAYFDDINTLAEYVEALTGVRTGLIRFPGGSSNTVSEKYRKGIMTELTGEVAAMGYRYFDWNVDSSDASSSRALSASAIFFNVKKGCAGLESAMILMHDTAEKKSTVTALPRIIEYLLENDYELLPITEETPEIHHPIVN